jgi:hypothetical protein
LNPVGFISNYSMAVHVAEFPSRDLELDTLQERKLAPPSGRGFEITGLE